MAALNAAVAITERPCAHNGADARPVRTFMAQAAAAKL
jgi:hypothetical protein